MEYYCSIFSTRDFRGPPDLDIPHVQFEPLLYEVSMTPYLREVGVILDLDSSFLAMDLYLSGEGTIRIL